MTRRTERACRERDQASVSVRPYWSPLPLCWAPRSEFSAATPAKSEGAQDSTGQNAIEVRPVEQKHLLAANLTNVPVQSPHFSVKPPNQVHLKGNQDKDFSTNQFKSNHSKDKDFAITNQFRSNHSKDKDLTITNHLKSNHLKSNQFKE